MGAGLLPTKGVEAGTTMTAIRMKADVSQGGK